MNRIDLERERRAVFFLARLERLCHLEDRLVSPPEVVVNPERLVHKAIFATYCDCVLLGRKDDAERVLATGRPGRSILDAPAPPQPEPAA